MVQQGVAIILNIAPDRALDLESIENARRALGKIKVAVDNACKKWDTHLQPTIADIYKNRLDKTIGNE